MNIQFKEIDIENFIWENIPNGTLQKRGFAIREGLFYRQVNIPGCGIVDLAGIQLKKCISENMVSNVLDITIYELKRTNINCAHVGQLARYVDCLTTNASEISYHFGFPKTYQVFVHGVLVGSGIERDAHHLLNILGGSFLYAISFEFDFTHGVVFKPITGIEPPSAIALDELPRPKFEKLARASYPITLDFRPKQYTSGIGDSESDSDIPQSSFNQ